MATPGRVPMRAQELSRERDAKARNGPEVKNGTLRQVTNRPEADPEWHPSVIRIYDSLAESGQSDFFQNSDWAFAWSVCEDLSFYKFQQVKQGRPHAESLKALLSALNNLMLTEADRRRARIELQEEERVTDSPAVAVMASYRDKLNNVNNKKKG